MSLTYCPMTAVDDVMPVAAASVKPTRPSHSNNPLTPSQSLIYLPRNAIVHVVVSCAPWLDT